MPHGKVAGAASGIGREFAHAYARAGAALAIVEIDFAAAPSTIDQIVAGGGLAMAVAIDVTYEKAVNAGDAEVLDTGGKLDIPISNAGSQIVKPIVGICPGFVRTPLVGDRGRVLLARRCGVAC